MTNIARLSVTISLQAGSRMKISLENLKQLENQSSVSFAWNVDFLWAESAEPKNNSNLLSFSTPRVFSLGENPYCHKQHETLRPHQELQELSPYCNYVSELAGLLAYAVGNQFFATSTWTWKLLSSEMIGALKLLSLGMIYILKDLLQMTMFHR